MSSTRTPGIRIDNRTNCLIIDKEHRGIPIYVRLGVTDQDSAERRLSEEVRCVNEMLALRSSRRATFADCAGRYLSAFKGKHAAEVTAWHIRLLLPYIGRLDVHSVHDATLQSFIADRVASGVCATTINRTLEVVRSIRVRRALVSTSRWHPMVANDAAAHHDAGGDTTSALPYYLERTGPIIFAITSSPRPDGALCREYWVAREQRMQAAVGMGGCGTRIETQRFRCSAGRMQDAPRARRDSQRRRMVGDPRATRPGCGVGVSLSREAGGNDEQHGVATRAKGSWPSTRPNPRLAPHLRVSTARSGRVDRRSASAAPPRESIDGGALRKRRRWALGRTSQSGVKT